MAEIDEFADALTDRQTRLLAYWHERRGNRDMPSRRDLDPADIRSLLPNLVLIDVAEGCTDFRFRLIGTSVAGNCSRDHTGKRFSELDGYGSRGYGWNNSLNAATRRRPRIGHLPYTGPLRSITAHHNLTLPLSSDGWNVDMILCVSEFERQITGGTELV